MGSGTARLTTADFHVPPELRDRRLAEQGAGRVGGVCVELLTDPAGARLGNCYQQVPLRVLPPFRFGPGLPALLYLLNPTAGLFDGDAHLVRLTAKAGTRAIVTGQSATRIHPSLGSFATQQWEVRVESGAVLVILPGPAIPFHECQYYQRAVIHLDEGAGLVWGDLWLSGRHARGVLSEQFQFGRLIQDLTVRRLGQMVFRDRFCWNGPWDESAAAWHFGPGHACGSLFVSLPAMKKGDFATLPSADALFATACGDHCLRWRGDSEVVTRALVQAALGCAGMATGGRSWLALQEELAPNHWFSAPGFLASRSDA